MIHKRYILHLVLSVDHSFSKLPNIFYGTLITWIKLICTDQILDNQFYLCHSCPILI
jgi:hypothetical protein